MLLGFEAVAPSRDDLISSLVPPQNFADADFDSYHPDKRYPSQQQAKETLIDFVRQHRMDEPSRWRRRQRSRLERPIGWYLDGGFGVGKTHLLAATFTAWRGPKYYVSFSGLTSLVGALSFGGALDLLQGATLLAIDEFELDDPGDTVLISRLAGELVETGTNLVVTSNTLPSRLGEGRFAAEDFLREIQGLADAFRVITIEGGDFRRRAFELNNQRGESVPLGDGAVRTPLASLLRELGQIHPVRYRGVVSQLVGVEIYDASQIVSQVDALRFCSLVDVLYDFGVPVRIRGVNLAELFPSSFLAGGFRHKYGRCLSRLVELEMTSGSTEWNYESGTGAT